jgi:hypothetical protein
MMFSVDFQGTSFLHTSRVHVTVNSLNSSYEILLTRNIQVKQNRHCRPTVHI